GEVVSVVYEDEALAHGAGLVAAERGGAVGKPVDAAGKRKVGRSPIDGSGGSARNTECSLDVGIVREERRREAARPAEGIAQAADQMRIDVMRPPDIGVDTAAGPRVEEAEKVGRGGVP